MSDASQEPAADAGAAALAQARTVVSDVAARLSAAGARSEVLAEFVAERRVLGIPRAARMRPLGRVWRLGVLLVAADPAAAGIAPLFALGRVVRAEPPARRSVVANAVAEHCAYRVAAVKGGIAAGETVDFDAVPLRLDGAAALADPGVPSGPAVIVGSGVRDGAGPLVVRDARVLVRWNPGQPDALAPLDRYLAERVELLLDPRGGT